MLAHTAAPLSCGAGPLRQVCAQRQLAGMALGRRGPAWGMRLRRPGRSLAAANEEQQPAQYGCSGDHMQKQRTPRMSRRSGYQGPPIRA